jgi:hypothetical protein
MLQAFKHMFTGVDNTTWDIGRILWAKMALVYCVVSAYHAVMHGAFDPQNWAIGASAILAGGGGGLALKSKTEPNNVSSS